jgi:tRNA threonylcarbamoyladenosine biosynthesis protein TsaE
MLSALAGTYECSTPDDTYELGIEIGRALTGGEVLLLSGELGAGKTLLAKGLLAGMEFGPDEVTSPSFALVNLYRTQAGDVYHIDLWRLLGTAGAAQAVGLDEILQEDRATIIIEWPEALNDRPLGRETLSISIEGVGDEPRAINVRYAEENSRP